ncbi:hypothetical protein [Streptomyces huiliensis]|uniref:hypothetical protein n=1 Tax=Streptomyces huiliensis TaxID=2876027 RepID=UPI001CBF23B0|nr:hypothetical protein [Streptomyces huiliensis]MBZ4323525.1 hypothetical protein [Streptomyces huiliensis]
MADPDLKVITDGIRTDARMWDAQSTLLGGIHNTVEGLRMTRLEAGLFQVLLSAYTDAVNQISSRTSEGRDRTKEVADTLVVNARAYEDHEVDTTKSVEKAY